MKKLFIFALSFLIISANVYANSTTDTSEDTNVQNAEAEVTIGLSCYLTPFGDIAIAMDGNLGEQARGSTSTAVLHTDEVSLTVGSVNAFTDTAITYTHGVTESEPNLTDFSVDGSSFDNSGTNLSSVTSTLTTPAYYNVQIQLDADDAAEERSHSVTNTIQCGGPQVF